MLVTCVLLCVCVPARVCYTILLVRVRVRAQVCVSVLIQTHNSIFSYEIVLSPIFNCCWCCPVMPPNVAAALTAMRLLLLPLLSKLIHHLQHQKNEERNRNRNKHKKVTGVGYKHMHTVLNYSWQRLFRVALNETILIYWMLLLAAFPLWHEYWEEFQVRIKFN